MNATQTLLIDLEGLFVREFRACQALHKLTRDERRALSRDEVAHLHNLTAQKEGLLDELAKLEGAKYTLLHELGIVSESASPTLQTLKLVDFLAVIDQDSAQRLLRLQEGILVLMGRVRDLTRGNQALATSALLRANSLQAYLLRPYHISIAQRSRDLRSAPNQPWNSPERFAVARSEDSVSDAQANLAAVFAAIVTARDALYASDTQAISKAISDLQKALENAIHFPALEEQQTPVTQEASKHPTDVRSLQGPSLQEAADVNLVETIANLYHQETVYQAILNVSNRMLALV